MNNQRQSSEDWLDPPLKRFDIVLIRSWEEVKVVCFNATKQPERSEINKYSIDLELGKKPLYRLIYSLGPIKLKIFKTYIKTNLANGFIWPSKSAVGALILSVQKPDGSVRLYMDYLGLNNLTIENR